ncbi:MAG: MoxR family ATPase [Leptospirales bacterium]|nr:MoxR family ATPase [Leptospirales bacterium]
MKEYIAAAKSGIARLIANIRSVIVVQTTTIETIIASKIAGGHVILADAHGVGKTSLARALSGSIDWGGEHKVDGVKIEPFSRIQCTVDLLPQDILGFNRFDMQSNKSTFHSGPIFANFLLCDEINLLTPKTQGSFLQVMEEQKVTIEGKTYAIPDPFFIIATMNLKGSHLFPLPAPQLDRFMVQISLGYPSEQDEIQILAQHGKENSWSSFKPVIAPGELLAWTKLVDEVSLHPDVASYIVRIIRQTRKHPGVITGASPRAGIRLSRLVRALALVRGQDFVTPDMVKEMVFPALSHRIELEDPSRTPASVLQEVLKEVAAPG